MHNSNTLEQPYQAEVAIIGMKGRFPGAGTIDEFWQNLKEGIESVAFFSAEELETAGVVPEVLETPNYVKAKAVLADVELFDAQFFGYSRSESELMDPQHRIFLECAWEALEDAGCNPEIYDGRIGIFAGAGVNTYLLFNLYTKPQLLHLLGGYQTMIANEKDHLSTRVSYKLNLKGPSITVQTACSTSLVSIHLACQSLLNGECDMAMAGGISITIPKVGYFYQEGMLLSPHGHCRAFDARGQGFVEGNGVGIVVLKRLADAFADGDYLHAVIKGSAVNNDGSTKVGYTASSVEGQVEVISEALAMAGVDPETITYVETHGAGTPLGDPIEITALTQAFANGGEKKGYCAIGSVKTNLGHLGAAAGVSGLIKTVLALKHKEIPPCLHFEEPNPRIDLANTPFFVNTAHSRWQSNGMPRRAGVSSFGIGGTNAHVVLEEAPLRETGGETRPWQLLVLSAKTKSALNTATLNLVNHLKQFPQLNLADVASTLQMGRRTFNHRRMLVCSTNDDAVKALETLHPERVYSRCQEPAYRPVVFMFPGHGPQYVNMGLELFQVEPLFRETVNNCAHLLRPELGIDLCQVLFPQEDNIETAHQQLQQFRIAQAALFVIEYALARLWISWGVVPRVMIGHSLGEYVAACLAGVFSLEHALRLVTLRGRLYEELPAGAMLSVALPDREVQPFLGKEFSVAAVNAPSLCVLSGPGDAVDRLETLLAGKGIESRRLRIPVAAHSKSAAPILEEFLRVVKKIPLKPPSIPYISNVSGTWLTDEEAVDPGYWGRHLCETVRFAEGIHALWQEPSQVFLEVGPGRTLCSLVNQHAEHPGERLVLPSLPHARDRCSGMQFLLNTLGQLWLGDIPVDWAGFYANQQRLRLPLPTYPFERQRYWVEPENHISLDYQKQREPRAKIDSNDSKPGVTEPKQRLNLPNEYIAPRSKMEETVASAWQELLGIQQVGVYDDFYALGGHSLLAAQLIARLQKIFPVELPLRDLFEALTVARMAEIIEKVLIEKIEELSEEEAQTLMEKLQAN